MAGPQCSVSQISTDVLSNMLEQDEETKKRLVEIYDDVKLLLSEEPDATLDAEISAQYKDYKSLLDNYQKDMTGNERSIVVTGRTSVGKSSVLNALLGFNVLPTATLACTVVICRLRTNKTKKADIVDFNEKIVKTIEMEDDDENKFRKELRDYICLKKKREHPIKYVDIYWPIPFLRKNIILADTPGYGERKEMDERLIQYLPSAVAFIFVIDSCCGALIDSMVPLFKAIQDNNNGIRQAFDPSCAIFLCNKWDLLDEDEEDDVWKYLREKLTIYWPNIQDKQIYRFSAKKTLKTISKQQKLPEEFINLKEGIEELIEVSIGAKSRQHIFWLEKFLMTIRMNVTWHLKNTTVSHSQRRKQVNRGEKLLEMLQNCCDTEITEETKQGKLPVTGCRKRKGELQKEAEKECERLAKTINDHMHDTNNRNKMFPWHKVRLPEKGANLDEIKTEAYRIIQDFVNDELNKCIQQYGGQASLDKLLAKITKEKKLIQKAQNALEQLSQNPETIDNEEPETFDDIKVPENFEYNDAFFRTKIAMIALSPLWFPVVVAAKDITRKDRTEVRNYTLEKTKYMAEWANQYLNTSTKWSWYDWLKQHIFGIFYQNFDELFNEQIPQTISDYRKFFHDLEERNDDLIREHYQSKLDKCNQILETLHALSLA